MRKPNTSLSGTKEAPSSLVARGTAHCALRPAPAAEPNYRLRGTE